MGDLGVDILQNGSPILITWEVRLHSQIYKQSIQVYRQLTLIELSGLRNRRFSSK
jgi:hypothetical protein